MESSADTVLGYSFKLIPSQLVQQTRTNSVISALSLAAVSRRKNWVERPCRQTYKHNSCRSFMPVFSQQSVCPSHPSPQPIHAQSAGLATLGRSSSCAHLRAKLLLLNLQLAKLPLLRLSDDFQVMQRFSNRLMQILILIPQ